VALEDGQWFVYGLRPETHVDLPDELYLREMEEVDIGDPSSLHGFVSRWGRLDWPAAEFGQYRSLPRLEKGVPTRAVSKRYSEEDVGERWGYRGFGHVKETAIHVAALRNCRRAYSWLQEPDAFDPAIAEWEMPEVFQRPTNTSMVFLQLKRILEPALKVFAPSIWGSGWSYPGSDGRISCDLYAGLALQLFNHIAKDARYRTCAECGGFFVRQQGRAKYDNQRHYQGVKYCTSQCKERHFRRQYEREHPDRKRRTKKEEG